MFCLFYNSVFFAQYYYIVWICLHCCCFGFSVVFIFSIWNAHFLVCSEFLCTVEFLSFIIFAVQNFDLTIYKFSLVHAL